MNIVTANIKMYSKQFIGVLILLFSLNHTYAQQIVKHFSSWNAINLNKTINNKWSFNNEFNFRRTNFLKNWEQIIVRPFIHYKVNRDLDLAIGYSYIKNYHYSDYSTPIDFNEHNMLQQLTLKQKFSKFSFHHRLRFEERWQQKVVEQENNRFSINGHKFRNRFRYRFQCIVQLKSFKNNSLISLVIYDEVHLDFEASLRPKKLDQNWMFVGLNLYVNEHMKVRSGYHDVYAKRNETFRQNKIWETTITYNI